MVSQLILLRGGGDLASGVALRLHRCGFRILVTELAQPLVVRRLVSFAQAVYQGEYMVEDVPCRLASNWNEAQVLLDQRVVPVMVDADSVVRLAAKPDVLVDARMIKKTPDLGCSAAELVVGLGPGFTAGKDCHAVVETMRGHFLGRVYWQGGAIPDSRLPEAVGEFKAERVLRAPAEGILKNNKEIGERVKKDEPICEVAGQVLKAPFDGWIRGLLHDGLAVEKGLKIGDIDPRDDERLCRLVSDKALAIGGGVLEAILGAAFRKVNS